MTSSRFHENISNFCNSLNHSIYLPSTSQYPFERENQKEEGILLSSLPIHLSKFFSSTSRIFLCYGKTQNIFLMTHLAIFFVFHALLALFFFYPTRFLHSSRRKNLVFFFLDTFLTNIPVYHMIFIIG